MKYVIIVPDGMADYPVDELNGKTPLEVAQTPNMDRVAQNGLVGMVQTIPDGLSPGSDIGNLSVLGYDPKKCFSGRAPLEAANMGITLKDNEVAFRCNLVTVTDETMVDYSAGHISSEEAAALIASLNEHLATCEIRFYPGKSYRHLLVLASDSPEELAKIVCTPPHDITNKKITSHLPKGSRAQTLLDLMRRSVKVLQDHPINKVRVDLGQNPATMIWLWGQGRKPALMPFKEKFGVSGSVISAVDLVNGIGKLIGLEVIQVPNATGYYDTNYAGKAQYALDSLRVKDFVFVHIEATDEASHNGDLRMKIACLERIDKEVVGPVLAYAKKNSDTRILILPDHRTPVAKRTHTREPVCFAMCGPGIKKGTAKALSEPEAEKTKVHYASGEALVERFIKGA